MAERRPRRPTEPQRSVQRHIGVTLLHAGPVRTSAASLAAVLALAVAGCASPGSDTFDCAAQVRLDGRIYTAYGSTERSAATFAVADEADCHDVGEDAEGSVFPDDPRQVTVWAFDG